MEFSLRRRSETSLIANLINTKENKSTQRNLIDKLDRMDNDDATSLEQSGVDDLYLHLERSYEAT